MSRWQVRCSHCARIAVLREALTKGRVQAISTPAHARTEVTWSNRNTRRIHTVRGKPGLTGSAMSDGIGMEGKEIILAEKAFRAGWKGREVQKREEIDRPEFAVDSRRRANLRPE